MLDMLLALIRALSKMPEPAGPELETWESLVFHCKTLEVSANDLVAGALHSTRKHTISCSLNISSLPCSLLWICTGCLILSPYGVLTLSLIVCRSLWATGSRKCGERSKGCCDWVRANS